MTSKIAELIKNLIIEIGENPEREGLIETPKRVEKMYVELLNGYNRDPKEVFKYFDSDNYDGIIVVKDITFYSLCEHHMLPFYGKVHIGYIPDKKVVGLSKFSRLVEIYARRLQLQERMTKQIAQAIEDNLSTKGLIVYCEAKHLCLSMRGAKQTNSRMETIVKRGVFSTNKALSKAFFDRIRPDDNNKGIS